MKSAYLKILTPLCFLCMFQGCTVVATLSGPFVGMYSKTKNFTVEMEGSSLKTIEKIGILLAFPASLISGAIRGILVGPFVGLGADIEYITTGKIDLTRLKEKFSDATEKYKVEKRKPYGEKTK